MSRYLDLNSFNISNMDIHSEMIRLISLLYTKPNFTESDISFLISIFGDFITKIYCKRLSVELSKTLDSVTAMKIQAVFKNFENPFQQYEDKRKRLSLFKKGGLFVEPEENVVKTCLRFKFNSNILSIIEKNVRTIHLPIHHCLRLLLETKGLLNATINYMGFLKTQKFLESDNADKRTAILFNLTQCSLWKEKLKDLENEKKNGILLPALIEYDDLETGNALGANAGKNCIGCVYLSIPSFPPNFSSKMKSIILTDLFYSSDRKTLGNDAIFSKTIEELNDLRQNGLEIYAEGKVQKIYIITCFLNGDNLGLNAALGFIQSFSGSHSCRICYADGKSIKNMVEEEESLLRTSEKHILDSNDPQPQVTGVREKCCFAKLFGFCPIKSCACDSMHDVSEGVANYVMALIILILNAEGIVSAVFINFMFNTLDFAFETKNIPEDIDIEYLKRNHRLKISSAQVMFLVRYFGIMVGHLVPRDHDAWKLYVHLHTIVSIISSPNITWEDLNTLRTQVKSHHELYLKFGADLTIKFHLLVHYVRVILQNGPPVHISTMQLERKHREIKAIAVATPCKKFILKTIAKRYLLSLANQIFVHYNERNVTYTTATNASSDEFFNITEEYEALSSVEIENFKYKLKTIIVENFDVSPEFGEVDRIYLIGKRIFFRYIPFVTVGFDNHMCAWSVVINLSDRNIIEYDDLGNKVPCISMLQSGIQYICTRSRL